MPLIRLALQLDGPAPQYAVFEIFRLLGMHDTVHYFHAWATAYRNDFCRRGINAQGLPFDDNGYLPAGWQEVLLFPQGYETVDLPDLADVPRTTVPNSAEIYAELGRIHHAAARLSAQELQPCVPARLRN